MSRLPVSADAETDETPGSAPMRCAISTLAPSPRSLRARTRRRPGTWEAMWRMWGSAFMERDLLAELHGLPCGLRGGRAVRGRVVRLSLGDDVLDPLDT